MKLKYMSKYYKVVTISNYFETLNLGKGIGRAHYFLGTVLCATLVFGDHSFGAHSKSGLGTILLGTILNRVWGPFFWGQWRDPYGITRT
jgi:hypothetical protein